jgi:hypothetical protein
MDILHNTREFSILGVTSQQQYADLIAWEIFFQRYKIKSFIELGSGHGGMSLYFLAQSVQQGFLFSTFDTRPPSAAIASPLGHIFNLAAHFYQKDVFTTSLADYLVYPCCIYCDNGDKPKEFQMVAALISGNRHRNFIVTHDWDIEIHQSDIPSSWVCIHDDITDQLGSITRFFEEAPF